MSCTNESEVLDEHKNSRDGDGQARSMADTIARRSYGKLVAFLTARTRDVTAAEDALSEAFIAALADWPRNGCPANPEAWLLTVARRKLIDAARRRRRGEMATEQLQLLAEDLDAAQADADIPDHRLALMFACAHPAIEAGIRAPLMLQVVLGLNAATIASAFLTSPTTMGQRLVGAKNKIRQAGIPFRRPLSTRRRIAIGARLSPPHRPRQLGRGGAIVRRLVGAFRLTGSRDQSRPGYCGAARRRCRSPCDGRARC